MSELHDAAEYVIGCRNDSNLQPAIDMLETALRKAIEQDKQEPVMRELTDNEIEAIADKYRLDLYGYIPSGACKHFARAIEAELKGE